MEEVISADHTLANSADLCGSEIRPLMLAANAGHSEVVLRLLEAGAAADVAHRDNGVTPLMAAADGGHVETVRLLVSKQVKLDQTEARNWTALSVRRRPG